MILGPGSHKHAKFCSTRARVLPEAPHPKLSPSTGGRREGPASGQEGGGLEFRELGILGLQGLGFRGLDFRDLGAQGVRGSGC